MAKAGKWILFVVALAATWLVLNAVFPQLGAIGILPALLIVSGVLVAAGALGFKIIPMKVKPIWGIAVLVIGLFLGGMLSSVLSGFGGLIPSAVPAATIVPSTVTPISAPVSADACKAGIAQDILGTSATVDFNAYDLAADSPYSSAVDTTVQVFKAGSVVEGNAGNFVSTVTDTSASGTTGFAVGDVISVAGGNTSSISGNTGYYVEKKDGVCLDTQRKPVQLDAHRIQVESSMSTTIYDDTGSTALSSGANDVDYTTALAANEEKSFFYKIKNNGANSDYWLGAIGTATLTNISETKIGNDDASKFTSTRPATPLFAKDVSVSTNTTGSTAVVRSYSIYRLKEPVMLKEFQSKTYQITTKASANDPVGDQGLATMSGFVICALDQAWAKGSDGTMHLDIHDWTSSENNVGLSETLSSPADLQTCGVVAAT